MAVPIWTPLAVQFDPRRRITVNEALKHPWLAQLHDESAEPSAPGKCVHPQRQCSRIFSGRKDCSCIHCCWKHKFKYCVMPAKIVPLLIARPINIFSCSVSFRFAGVFKFDFEEQDLDEATVRRLVWREMMYYQTWYICLSTAIEQSFMLPPCLITAIFAVYSLILPALHLLAALSMVCCSFLLV